jgi:hypothetical protein
MFALCKQSGALRAFASFLWAIFIEIKRDQTVSLISVEIAVVPAIWRGENAIRGTGPLTSGRGWR